MKQLIFLRRFFLPLSLLLGWILWEAVVRLAHLPPFLLPSPGGVAQRLVLVAMDGTLLRHTLVTLVEVLLGLVLGVSVATVMGYFIARSSGLERLLSPYLIASQAVPVVAIAPLLMIWFGSGLFTKVLICSLIVFFPVLVNTVVGVRSTPVNLHALLQTMHASRWQVLWYLEIPAALPVFLGGLRIGATLSVIGAVVGEFVGADSGLGFLINVGRGQYDTALVFAALITLVGLALGLYGLVILAEKRWLGWKVAP